MYNILYYDGGDSAKRTKVAKVLSTLALPYRMIEAHELTNSIGELFDEENTSAKADTAFNSIDFDLMMMQGIEDEKIQEISLTLRAQDCHVQRKAMLTKHNIAWKFIDLLKEIEEEHAYFQKYDEIKQAILDFQNMHEESYTKDSWNVYQEAIVQGYALLQDRGDKQQLTMSMHLIEQALQNLQKI